MKTLRLFPYKENNKIKFIYIKTHKNSVTLEEFRRERNIILKVRLNAKPPPRELENFVQNKHTISPIV